MGDDPYDFEIAFPAAPNSASRSTRKHRNSSGSDDDGSDASGGLSSMSSISSDSEHETDHKRQYRTESSFNRAPKSFNDPKGAASGAVSSGSALDKARSFLSKYSSATKDKPNGSDPPNSSRSRRISLELDDEDEFSAGSSSGDDGIRSKSAIPVNLSDLVPDGMRNLLTATSTANRKSEVCPSNPEDVRVQRVPQPPPPPISSMFGSPMYSLDILKLPGTSSTSIYKQQLLALQEQILQKKRETERIVHDRMTFQYSSSRGTERFLAARRTQKLELWEALMRVDPTLDEQKAREVARLSQAAST
ncbi:Elicitin protein [Phytophthora cinnamomi]|uniref:Elicitin protein n=1 Tax=Phytophthora cinnamomi TaxID=4785 RepID=UPI003559C296|nr:Elicitin protein [Phytophthora cinnamomi]